MDIFISWSGNRSGACAKALRDWLPCVMQSVKLWCSSEDIAKGARGGQEIAQKLESVNFGIVCLTPSNLKNEWIHYEAGALSKNLDNSALFTLLLGLQPTDVKPPLGHFQHTQINREEILKLVQAINSKAEKMLSSEVLSATFEAFWPKLESIFQTLPPESTPTPTKRTEKDLLEEVLSILRRQGQKSVTTSETPSEQRKAVALAAFAEGYARGRGQPTAVV